MVKAELQRLKAGQPVPQLVQTLSKECASFHQLLRKTTGTEAATETANGGTKLETDAGPEVDHELVARLKKEITEEKHGCNTVKSHHT